MGLPFTPESSSALRERFPAALTRLWDAQKIGKAGRKAERPGLYRQHVFDTEDGLRLIVSRDTHPDIDGQVLHISGSIDSAYVKRWLPRVRTEAELTGVILNGFKLISGLPETGIAQTHFTGVVVHLVYRLDPTMLPTPKDDDAVR